MNHQFLFSFLKFPSEDAIFAFVVHFFVVDVGDVGCSSLQVPRLLHFISRVVRDNRTRRPVEVLRWWREIGSIVRLVRSTDLMSDDLLVLTLAAAVRHCKDVEIEGFWGAKNLGVDSSSERFWMKILQNSVRGKSSKATENFFLKNCWNCFKAQVTALVHQQVPSGHSEPRLK